MADLDYFSLSESTLKELAGQGDAEAMIALGIGYYFGSFGEKDVSSAFDFLAPCRDDLLQAGQHLRL